MKFAVKFCGGCNPRYDRGKVFEQIKNNFKDRIEFEIAEEGIKYDGILVIGGCTNCCASYEQYDYDNSVFKIWDEEHVLDSLSQIEDLVLS